MRMSITQLRRRVYLRALNKEEAAMSNSVQGRVVWHDHNTTDLESAKRFYGELFAWSIKSEGQWHFIYSGNDQQHFGTINKLDAKHNIPSHWVPYIAVENIDAAIGAATKAGGKIQMGKTAAGKTGHFSYVADPQGAVFALWQYGPEGNGPKAELDGPPPLGHFCWDELLTSDPDAAEKFYKSVIGFQTQHMEMPGMRYTLWERNVMRPDGKPRQGGGMMKMPPGVPHPFWLSYVYVSDCDQSAEKAKKLGAQIMAPPMDIPNVGRFASLLDPTMASIAILGPGK
jgi:uncharacterized protein